METVYHVWPGSQERKLAEHRNFLRTLRLPGQMKKLLLFLTCLLAIANAAAADARGWVGGLDPGFGEGGRVVREVVPGLTGGTEAQQAPDGTIYALCRGALFALRPSGRPDLGFGEGGRVVVGTLLPKFENPQIAVDSQGRVVVAGTDRTPEGEDRERLALARLLPDGNLDPSFRSNGLVITDLGLGLAEQRTVSPFEPDPGVPGVYVRPEAIAADPFGRLVVTLRHVTEFEQHFERNMTYLESRAEGLTARFGPGGEIDTTFGEKGKLTSFSSRPVPAPDGSLYEAAWVGKEGVYAIHLDPDGGLDPSFGSDGWRRLPNPSSQTQIAYGPKGLFVLQSHVDARGREISVRRLLSDGRLDRRFGKRGVFRMTFGPATGIPLAAPDPRGGLFLAAQWNRGKNETSRAKTGFLLAHLTPRGRFDRHFGRIRTGFGRRTEVTIASLWVDQHDRPVAAGLIESPHFGARWGVALARYRSPH
jgi:uncharacterized delta-60 repeat protein